MNRSLLLSEQLVNEAKVLSEVTEWSEFRTIEL